MIEERIFNAFSAYVHQLDISGLTYNVFFAWWEQLNLAVPHEHEMREFVARYKGGTMSFWSDHVKIKAEKGDWADASVKKPNPVHGS